MVSSGMSHPPPQLPELRFKIQPLPAGAEGEPACVEALVAAPPTLNRIRAGLELVKLRVVDETGALDITFFNQASGQFIPPAPQAF